MNRVFGGLLTVVLAPVMALVAVAVRVFDGRPVLFAHQRAGQGGRPFHIYKFRTMRPPLAIDEPDEVRITRLGRALRRTSLDELPTLWNIVRGDMNLVGPRPLPVAYTAPVLIRPVSPSRSQAGPDRSGPGGRPQCPRLGRKVRPGQLVRRASQLANRSPHPLANTRGGRPRPGHLPPGTRHHAGVHGQPHFSVRSRA